MSVYRRHRFITVLLALFSLLFMQLAVAGHTCLVDTRVDARMGEMAAMAEAGMPCADDMSSQDSDHSGLCHVHCQSAQQTADQLPAVAPVGAVAMGIIYTIEPARVALTMPVAQAPSLLRSSAPPIAVRNCCFRI